MSTAHAQTRPDNTAGTAGIIYQFYAALDACFSLRPNQVLVIEKYGDVTILGDSQIEIKQYGDNLTDAHDNFWNTLTNWMDARFDESKYQKLILLTTQQYGAKTRFLEWNASDTATRLKILEEILAAAEQRFVAIEVAAAPEDRTKLKPPASLIQQRNCLHASVRQKLTHVVSKMMISAGSAGDIALHDRIKATHCHTIATAKMDLYVNGLLGYVCGAKSTEKRFEITYDDFKKHCETLGTIYCKDSRQFPRIRSKKAADQAEIEKHGNESLFASKIREIEYIEVLNEAVRNYLEAVNLVDQEFRERNGYRDDYLQFAEDVESMLKSQYRSAGGTLKPEEDVIAASKRHYDNAMVASPPAFPGMENPSHRFRNGVIHILCNDSTKELKWRLG